MADFPTSLPSITNPTANDTLAAVPHHTQHEHANDNLAAIGAKLGTGSSTPTIHQLLVGSGTGTSAWGTVIGSGSGATGEAGYEGQLLKIKDGSLASPDEAIGPTVQIERYSNVPDAAFGGSPTDGAGELSALMAFHKGTGTNQPVGVYGGAETSGIANGTGSRQPDATGGYFFGNITGSGIGRGIGSFHYGRTVSDSQYSGADGMQIVVANNTGGDHTASATTIAQTTGMWINAIGDQCGAGIQFGNGFGAQFDVGILFNSNSYGGVTGPVASATIMDASSSNTGYADIGSHNFGIDLHAATYATAAVWLPNGTPGAIRFLNAAGNAADDAIHYSAADVLTLGTGTDGVYVTTELGIAGGISLPLGGNIRTDTTTGMKIGTATNQKLGFWNATPSARPAAVADAAGGATQDAEARAAINALLARLRTIGFLAP